MLSRGFILTACIAIAVAPSPADADWTDYISDVGSVGMDTTLSVADMIGKNQKLTSPLLDPSFNTMGNLLTLTQAIPEAVKRQQEYNLGLGTTLWEQTAITGAGWLSGKALSATVTWCLASASCAIVGTSGGVLGGAAYVGAAIDADLIGKDVKSVLDYRHELEQLAASQQEVKILQQRLDDERDLKQLLQAQRSTPQWQNQRDRQLALQTMSQKSGTAPASANTHPSPVSSNPENKQNPSTPAITAATVDASRNQTSGPAQSKAATPATAPAPAPPASANSGRTTVAAVSPAATLSPAAVPSALPRNVAPGGISLTRAAAERMPLNLSIEGAFVRDGRIVLAGRRNSEGSIDAALFLTALRATCEGRDPYFSLDPDDISAWLDGTRKVGEEFLEHIKKDTAWSLQRRATRTTPSILDFRTLAASQSYSAYWASELAKYPQLKSRLVFGPEWLRQTRFGEILYKADVLLKELAGGASILGTTSLRASKIDDYRSATQLMAARGLLSKYQNLPVRDATPAGGRIWYDLTETSDKPTTTPEAIPAVGSELHTLLQRRHLLPDLSTVSVIPVSLPQSEGMLDISNVYPRMYVRIRDPITHRDGIGNFPGVNELVAEANRTPQRYAAAYREYQALVEVFRAYVVAVHARRTEPRLCAKIPKGLLDAEKVSAAMPEYHPTDMAVTIGWYEYSDGRLRRAIGTTSALFQGGVSVGATALFTQVGRIISDTPILRELKLESGKVYREPTWEGADNRRFVSFSIDADENPAAQERQSRLPPALVTRSPEPSGSTVERSAPSVATTIGRFDLHDGARIEGKKLNSVSLDSEYSKGSMRARNQCAQICSRDNDCIAFEIDQTRNICTTYSSISKTLAEPNWTHGVWR